LHLLLCEIQNDFREACPTIGTDIGNQVVPMRAGALENARDLAADAENWRYCRVAEHHNVPGIAVRTLDTVCRRHLYSDSASSGAKYVHWLRRARIERKHHCAAKLMKRIAAIATPTISQSSRSRRADATADAEGPI
jgi:hypothetical protein